MNEKNLKQKALKFINLSKLDFKFKDKPLLVSGVAMMYHELRESDKDIDMILIRRDHLELSKKLIDEADILEEPHKSGFKEKSQFSDLFGDHGILIYEFELWDSIMLFGYDELKDNALDEKDFLVISLEKLMMLSVIRGVYTERYLEDAKLIAKKSLIQSTKIRNI
ncbi:MAG: hypothetical protein Q9M91_03940 [Candidatus Dojkabacteria bacterium]|nr:hypothetical protein [Candidatus Dojkabacteria bacterium]MDQ7020964.1 hypothetical protein [Candidatus Dojkabacteria bacterium]